MSETDGRGPASSVLAAARTVWPWLLLGVLAWLGWRELKAVDLAAVRDLLRATDPDLVVALAALTAANLALAGFYDVVALGPRNVPPASAARWSVGTIGFAWSNFLTVGPLAGPALRLWLYRPLGVETARARRALAAILAAFSLGLLAWCGAVLVPLPAALQGPVARVALGAAFGAAAAMLWSSVLALRPLPDGGSRPSPWAMIAIAMADWVLAWVVFHMAMSGFHDDLGVDRSVRTFFVGQLVGLASFIPGGLGSADLYWAYRLSDLAGGHDRVVAGLLLYRAVYYVAPFLVATLVLAGHLVRTGRRTGLFVRSALASYAFACGAVLLASAASPALHDRALVLKETVPLALIEISHGASVVMGFLLLVVARGLARGYRSSHRVATALFAAGALATFVKGLDYEEALLSLAAAAALVVLRRSFNREGRLTPSTEYLVSTGLFAVILFVAVGIGSHDTFPAPGEIFGTFEALGHGERFGRGLVLLAALAGFVALRFGQRARVTDVLPDETALAEALVQARSLGRNAGALLVATGDKALFRADGIEGFVAYRAAGRFLIAHAEPVCERGRERDLLGAFLRHATDFDREVVLYQIGPALLPAAHDFGFTFFKLGEEGIVDLERFDLRGDKAKTWRHAVNSVERTGARLEIVPAERVRALVPDLARVSSAWLRRKGGAEKGFSIGRFDPSYLERFPCAVVRDGSNAIVAFANVLEGPGGEELSVDLMRFLDEDDGGLRGVMDYLFVKLMLHGKERGFRRFNLGMAPLAAVGTVPWARPIERLARQFFLHGEAWYNYQGLRRFKEKFDPVWEPRYMAYPRPWDWPLAIAAATMLISGGWRGWIPQRARNDGRP